jgi:hypothetical protein
LASSNPRSFFSGVLTRSKRTVSMRSGSSCFTTNVSPSLTLVTRQIRGPLGLSIAVAVQSSHVGHGVLTMAAQGGQVAQAGAVNEKKSSARTTIGVMCSVVHCYALGVAFLLFSILWVESIGPGGNLYRLCGFSR